MVNNYQLFSFFMEDGILSDTPQNGTDIHGERNGANKMFLAPVIFIVLWKLIQRHVLRARKWLLRVS